MRTIRQGTLYLLGIVLTLLIAFFLLAVALSVIKALVGVVIFLAIVAGLVYLMAVSRTDSCKSSLRVNAGIHSSSDSPGTWKIPSVGTNISKNRRTDAHSISYNAASVVR
jgi:hypothetical protein